MQKKRLVGGVLKALQRRSNGLNEAEEYVFFLQEGMYVWGWNWAKQNQLIKKHRKVVKGGKQNRTSYMEV